MKFRPMIDGSTWALIAFVMLCCGCPFFLDPGWLMATVLAASAALCLLPLFSIWYEIDGDDLVVYAFWRPSRFPISKIKEVARSKSMISAPATSLTQRLAIKFTDRSVTKSTAPMLISPADQRAFLAALSARNPSIILPEAI